MSEFVMPVVSIREVATFEEAASGAERGTGRSSLDILKIAGLTRREASQREAMIPIQTLGRLWNVTAHRFSVPFALAVAEAHTDTQQSYGTWGEMMNTAGNIRERLTNGFARMAAHADDPRWALRTEGSCFRIIRRWNYPNALPRAEAFAVVSELREWLIVMQKGIREPILPVGIRFPPAFLSALGEDEVKCLSGFFGTPLCAGREVSMTFPQPALSFSSIQHDPEKFSFLLKQLGDDLEKGRGRLMESDASAEGILPQKRPALPALRAAAPETGADDLDSRHRAALHEAALDAADFLAPLACKCGKLTGVDIGGGDLKVTEIFLRYLSAKISVPVELIVVDPMLHCPSPDILSRRERLEKELGASIALETRRWDDFEKNCTRVRRFDFAVSFQTFSLLASREVRDTFKALGRRLAPGGRLFAAFEPFDQATLPQYQNFIFYPRPIEWYRECALQSGFQSLPTSLYPAHACDPRQAMVGFRFFFCARGRT